MVANKPTQLPRVSNTRNRACKAASLRGRLHYLCSRAILYLAVRTILFSWRAEVGVHRKNNETSDRRVQRRAYATNAMYAICDGHHYCMVRGNFTLCVVVSLSSLESPENPNEDVSG